MMAYRKLPSGLVEFLTTSPPFLTDAAETFIEVTDGKIDQPIRRQVSVRTTCMTDTRCRLSVAPPTIL